MEQFSGNWALSHYNHVTDEIAFDDGVGPAATAVKRWLRGADDSPLSDASLHSGLRLTIDGNSFLEHVTDFHQLMFDVTGIQVNDYRAMAGKLESISGIGFLVPDSVPKWALTNTVDGIAVRYDDGDTKICDSLRKTGDLLIRQISTVTDEIYLDRTVLVYSPLTVH